MPICWTCSEGGRRKMTFLARQYMTWTQQSRTQHYIHHMENTHVLTLTEICNFMRHFAKICPKNNNIRK